MNRNLPIGIFDSGVGGLTVYRALAERLPQERFVYLGDTARVPYGTKSLQTVERYAVENARFLAACGIKCLVVACNTASALALPKVRAAVAGAPVVGVIEAGARAGVESSRTKRIGVIATEATISSGAYRREIEKLSPNAFVIERACPLFVPLAEEGETDSEIARLYAAKRLADLSETEIDALILGCTHYPLLRRTIQQTVGANVKLIDSGEATAREVSDLLARENLLREEIESDARETTSRADDQANGRAIVSNVEEKRRVEKRLSDALDHFYVTDAAERFARVAERFLGSAPAALEAVEVKEASYQQSSISRQPKAV